MEHSKGEYYYLLCYISKQYKIAQIHRLEEQQRDTLQHYYLDIEQKITEFFDSLIAVSNHLLISLIPDVCF